MLDVLRSKAEQMSLKVNIWKSVASEIPDNNIYSLIFIPSGSFGLITDSDEISKTYGDQVTIPREQILDICPDFRGFF